MPFPCFQHRDYADGSRESICLACYQTVAARDPASTEAEREALEKKHRCDPYRLDLVQAA